MSKYIFTSDPGHGWLQVELAELIRLGIANKISFYSYQSGGFVYLEEDSDAPLFIARKEELNEPVDYQVNHVEHTPIRSYASYYPPVKSA